ncbi:MAG: hypothetical protein U5K38_04175 [Woeseiaceae bacterium]|nr:hypothetical protein [Woeseiaceae bacterium]
MLHVRRDDKQAGLHRRYFNRRCERAFGITARKMFSPLQGRNTHQVFVRRDLSEVIHQIFRCDSRIDITVFKLDGYAIFMMDDD